MSYYQSLAALYAEKGSGWSFEETVSWYRLHGFVFDEPELFLMGRPVIKEAGEDAICSPTIFDSQMANCWYVHAFQGDIAKVWHYVPWQLPWICFDRRLCESKYKGLRFHYADVLRKYTIAVKQAANN